MIRLCRWRISVLLGCVAAVSWASAPTDTVPRVIRPVTSAYTLEIGGANLADTYLTPLEYNGWNAAIGYERWQAMGFSPRSWVQRLAGRIELDRTDNPARNATMWYAGLELSWGMMWRKLLPENFTVGLGPATSVTAGCVYNDRNGNNPASAKASWTVDLSAYATWRFKMGRVPVTLRYQASLPVVGAFFSPDYGELYYEIYLGNHNGLAHCAWWGSYFRMENLLTADLRFGATALRIGYRNNILSTKVNDITSRNVTNAFVIGVSGEWLSLDPRRQPGPDPEIINAFY